MPDLKHSFVSRYCFSADFCPGTMPNVTPVRPAHRRQSVYVFRRSTGSTATSTPICGVI